MYLQHFDLLLEIANMSPAHLFCCDFCKYLVTITIKTSLALNTGGFIVSLKHSVLNVYF